MKTMHMQKQTSTSTSVQAEDQSYCHDEHIFKAHLNAKCDKTVQIDSFDGDMCKNLTEIKQKNQMKIIKTLKEKVTNLSKKCTELKSRVFSSSNMLQSNDQLSSDNHLVDGQTDRPTDRPTDRHEQSNIPPLLRRGA
ncbi:hypothetical protein DPMN_100347 [Dreissena polymorpha]|uniref:Uncharacterized protein n=1 Tax=Dreissena polymorpha TaxID=45954 RepID=A0A9D4LH65_DREPO|nr:hypothetical protein DPMN_100347 [Dreissena polymorpha]